MSVSFETSDPTSLLRKFCDAVDQVEPKGKITTWVKHADGRHYTHASEHWRGKAFFVPSIGNGLLAFYIVRNTKAPVTTTVYGYYHGHLLETFLNHFDQSFENGKATSLPRESDNCN